MISNTLGAWLFTQTWQVAVLVLLVTAVAARWGRSRPHLAHALWLVVLLKCFTPPIWASPSGLFCWLRPAASPNAVVEVTDLGRVWAADSSATALVGQGLNRDGGLVGTIVEWVPGESDASHLGSSAARTRWWTFPTETLVGAAVGIWLVGVLFALTVGAVRAGRFVARLRRAPSREIAELTAAVDQLRQRLGVRRAVQVRVTRAGIGPVIVGLVRPTIYLPAALVEGWSVAALEPILAHELVHQRRGDLWFCWLQWLARGLWWFHPAVAWACRCWNREVERCCDEETVASMGYPPARYARSLLSVLERKMELRAAPVFPGVRPLDVTTYRLERIMRLGQGSRRRAPLWCWALMLVAALAVLPGAAFVAEAKDRRRTRRPHAPPPLAAPSADPMVQRGAPLPENSDASEDALLSGAERNAIMIAIEILTCDSRAWDRVTDGQRGRDQSVVWDRAALQRITKQLEADPSTNRLCAPRVLAREGQPAHVKTMSERPFVVGYQEVPANPGEARPGAAAIAQPIVKTLEEGVHIEVCGRRENRNQIQLHFDATVGTITEVSTTRDAAGREIQQPRRNESHVETTARLSTDEAFVCVGDRYQHAGGKPQRIIYIVKCENVERTTQPRSQGNLKVYSVADLVTPIPRVAELDVRAIVTEQPMWRDLVPAPVSPKAAEYEPLIKLIKSTITPSEWKPAGSSDILPDLDHLALIVQADAETHEKVADLLSQLRRLQDIQISYETMLLSPDENLRRTVQSERWGWREPNRVDVGPPIAILDETTAANLREQLASGSPDIVQAPKITLFNGQALRMTLPTDPASLRSATIPMLNERRRAAQLRASDVDEKAPHAVMVRFVTIASADRRKLRVSLAVGGTPDGDELLGDVAVREIDGAQTLVVDLSDDNAVRDWKERGPLARSPEGQAVLRGLVAGRPRQPLWLVLKPRVIVLDSK